MADQIRFDFSESRAYAQAVLDKLAKAEAEAAALGDEIEVARLRAQRAEVQKIGPSKTQVDDTTAAIARQSQEISRSNALKQAGQRIDVETLDVIKAQADARLEEQAILARQQLGAGIDRGSLAAIEARTAPAPPSPLLIAGARTPRAYEQTAGGLAAQEELNRSAEHYDQILAEQQSLYDRAIAMQREQLGVQNEETAQLERQLTLLDAITARNQKAFAVGRGAGQRGVAITSAQVGALAAPPPGLASEWTKGAEGMALWNAELGKYSGYASNAAVSSEVLSANFTRLGVAEAEASNQLRRHGALTTEFLGALARGETTVNEFGYQIGATIGKFAGWTAAATATYGALGAVVEFGKGAIDAASGVQQLTRTIDGLDREKASQAIINLSSETNVPIKEAADTIFYFSRSFHDLADATTVAKLALSAYKLDGVDVQQTVKAATAIHQQFGLTAQGLVPIFDQLAQGQQKFNARITDMIPLLQRSAGAVKNAGGNLNDFLTIATVALRTTQLSGSQLGTIFQRSAANFLNPATPKGQTDLATLRTLGINTDVFGPGQGGITKLFEEMIRRSATLDNADRQKLALAFSGTGLGGRAAALFGGGGAALLPQVQRELSPEASKGVLQKELDRELGTARERIHSFVNEMQRSGAAIADSGIVSFFTTLLHVLTQVGGGVRDVIQVFDGLPATVKEAATALLLLRTAMLFLNRTRFGSSFPGARFARIPGLDPTYEAQQARATLAIGTRTAIQAVEDEVARSASALTASAARQASLERQRAAVQAEIAAGSGDTEALTKRSNAINEQISILSRQQVQIEVERTASLEALAALKAQQVRLTSSGSRRASDAEVLALSTRVQGAGQTAASASETATATADEDAAAQARLSQWRTRQARATILDAEAIRAQGAAAVEQAAAADSAAATSEAALAETEASAGRLASFAARARGFATAIDPLFAAIVGIPFLIAEIDKLSHGAGDAVKATQQGNFHSFDALKQSVANALAKNRSPKSLGPSLGGLNPFQESEDSFDARYAAAQGYQDLQNAIAQARKQTFASPVKQVGYSIQALTGEAEADARAFKDHKITKQEFVRRMNELQRSAGSSLEVLTATSATQANAAIAQATVTIKSVLGKALTDTAKNSKDFLSALDHLDTKQLTANVQAYSARSQVYGLNSSDLRKAGETFLFLAARYRNSTDQQGLQLVQTAEQALVSAVNKNVQDMLNAAQSATTFQGASTDIGKAVGDITHARQQVAQWVAAMDKKFKNYPSIIRAVNEAARQLDAQFNQQLKSALDQQIQLIEQQASLRAAQITGTSPAADIQRAEVTLQGLQSAYAKAKAEGADYQTLAGLLTQIDQQIQSIAQQKIQNARAILEAQNQLAASAITGVGPGADLARAQQDVSNARRILAFDQANNAGQAAILQDQAAVNDALRSLNEQIKQQAQQQVQDLQAFIQSQVDLQTSETTDPVKQARDQLAGALRALATIKPSDYNTNQEYQTARNEALAKINQQRQSLNEQIVQTDLRNLQFEHDIHKIGDQAYIDGLRKILRTKKLTTEERQGVLEQIYQLKHQAGNLDLNVGNIKFPSIYQIRRAIGLGQRGVIPGSTNTTINHSAVVNVYVSGKQGAAQVGKVLDDHLNTSVRSAMRSAGVI